MFPRIRFLAAATLALALMSASLFAEGAACCEKPVSRTSLLTRKPSGQGTAPAVPQAPATTAAPTPVAESRAKRIALGLILGGFWFRGQTGQQNVADRAH